MLRSFINTIKSLLGRKLPDMASKQNEVQKILWIRRHENKRKMDGKFNYQFPLVDASTPRSRQFNFNRLISEANSEALMRLQYNIHKHTIKAKTKGRKKKSAVEEVVEPHSFIAVHLFDKTGAEIDGAVPNSHAWMDGGTLQIGDIRYVIQINTPTVLSIVFPCVLLSGSPLLPHLTLEFAEIGECDFQWVRVGNTEVTVSNAMLYTPSVEDIGHCLKLTVVPKRGSWRGEPEVVQSSLPVVQGPELMPVLSRDICPVQDTSPNSFRVVSYNLLADLYADSEFSRTQLFAHCHADYLHYDYRKSLIAKELLEYNTDIMCLQEMDEKHFKSFYQPLLDCHGYHSFMYPKRHYRLPEDWNSPVTSSFASPGTSPTSALDGDFEEEMEDSKPTLYENSSDNVVISCEGSALAFKRSKFRLIADCSINIPDVLENDSKYSDLKEAACNCRLVLEKLLYRSGCSVQVLVLESINDPSKRLCVATTHLYFHPQGTVVRLIQTTIALRHLQQVKSMYESEGCHVSVLFCGDFNSTPSSHVVQLVRGRRLSKTDKVWSESSRYAMQGIDLNHQFNVESACGYPVYTNYVPGFQECIDYIFYEKDSLFVESVATLPAHSFMAAQSEGIPSQHFPSDHLALCCELSWR